MNDPQRLLRNSLRANGAFSTLSGLAFTLGSGAIAGAIGLTDPRVLLAVGAGLLGFAGFLFFLSSRPEIPTATAMQIVWADLAWVIGTVPLVALGLLNGTGTIAALAIADVVLVFAVLQYLGVRRVRRGRTPVAATS